MYFKDLQNGLIAALKARLRSGELTERRLARSTGISQPHIHNVLNGTRILSPKIADRILEQFQIPLADLLPAQETKPRRCDGCSRRRDFQEVPIWEGRVGPGLPLSFSISRVERYPFPAGFLQALVNPAVARLAADARMRGALSENDLVLLDHRPEARSRICEEALYLVSRHGEGLIRRLTVDHERLWLVTEADRNRPESWGYVSLKSHHILDVVRARIVWIGRVLPRD